MQRLYEQVSDMELENIRLKNENKRLMEELGKEPEKKKDCKSCQFYMQHYIQVCGRYVKVNAGHCTQGIRTKTRTPEDTCRYYERRSI